MSIPTLIEALDAFKIDPHSSETSLCHQLDVFSNALAKDSALRFNLPSAFPSLWTHISDLWDISSLSTAQNLNPYALILSLSRFTRNLVANVRANQDAAFTNEPKIRQIVHHLTSFSQLENSALYPVTRMLVQTISNLITLNDTLLTRLWSIYTTLPEDKNILIRLLVSPDIRTVTSTMVLILNCVSTDRTLMMGLTSQIGLRIVILLLDRSEEWVEQEEDKPEENEAFIIMYRIFEALLKADLGTTLYLALSIEDEPVAPHQITLLKIIDSFLRDANEQYPTSSLSTHHNGYAFLSKLFLDMCSYMQRGIRKSLGINDFIASQPGCDETSSIQNSQKGDLKDLDLRLPKVSAALILVSQSITTIYLKHETIRESRVSKSNRANYEGVVLAMQGETYIEALIETLRLVDRFLPRIIFGKAAPAPGRAGIPQASRVNDAGFAYLKRDLVRLLGMICHERRNIQDRVRECGGIPVVMNLCVIDERNPYLQEHALFALRNILHHNIENQRIVDAMKPTDP